MRVTAPFLFYYGLMNNESLRAYLIYFYNYTPDVAQALIDRNGSEENRRALEDIVNTKRFSGSDFENGNICLSY